MQSGTIGYWIDQRHAGHAYVAEAVVLVLQFAFEQLGLHRVEICIVPRNYGVGASMEKLGIRDEGLASGTSRSTARGRTTSATASPSRSGTRRATWRAGC